MEGKPVSQIVWRLVTKCLSIIKNTSTQPKVFCVKAPLNYFSKFTRKKLRWSKPTLELY